MSTDVCLRPLAAPDDVNLTDLTTCTLATTAGGPWLRTTFTRYVQPRLPKAHSRAATAHVRAVAAMSYRVDISGLIAEEDLLLLDLY